MLDLSLGDIPAATTEDVEVAVNAARSAFSRNKGKDWAKASGAVRAKYLRAIAAKVYQLMIMLLMVYVEISPSLSFVLSLTCLGNGKKVGSGKTRGP